MVSRTPIRFEQHPPMSGYEVFANGRSVGWVRKSDRWTGRSYATVWQRQEPGSIHWEGSHATREEAGQMLRRAAVKHGRLRRRARS